MKYNIYIIFLALTFINVSSFFSQINIDTAVFKKTFRSIDNVLEIKVDSAFDLIKEVLYKAKKSKYAYGYSKSNLQLARYYSLKGKIDSAILFITPAIKFARASKDTGLIVQSYLLYARSLASLGEYNKAIEQALIAQRYEDHVKDFKLRSRIFHDLGFVHSGIGLHEKSINFYRKALVISNQIKDTFNIANINARIGGEFNYLSMYDTSLTYNLQGLRLFKLMKHKRGIGVSLVNLATTYSGLNMLDKSIQTSIEGIKIREELGDTYAITILKNNLVNCYYDKKEYQKALDMALDCEKLAKEQNEPELIFQNYNALSRIYQAINKTELALYYARKTISLKDSIFSKTNLKAINELQTKYETEKQEKKISELQFKNKSAEEKAKSDRINRNIIIASITLIAIIITLFTLLLYRRFNVSNNQNLIIHNQKKLVDEKQKEIIESITYAKRLQEAILPSKEFITKYLPNNFVLYKPKDIVAGDFYWMEVSGDYCFFAAADSTGHGVPGAMVSLVCSNALNRSIKEFKLIKTGEILNKTRELVLETFSKSSSEVKDGMDISLLCINHTTKKIEWSGANNPLWYFENGRFNVLKANKQPIGKTDNPLPFITHTINYIKGSVFYLFTDGYADQFGGDKGKKFKYAQFSDILKQNQNQLFNTQLTILNDAFTSWKGDLEQVDDVCVIGVKI